MAENIVQGLFGLSPFQIEQQQMQGLDQAADKYAAMDPFARATSGFYKVGGRLAQPAAGMLGMVNPAVEEAKRREAVMAQPGADLSTSAGLKQKAEQFRAAGDLRTATALALKANELAKEEAMQMLAQRKQVLSERKQEFQEQDAMDLKRQQLQQQYELAKERAADARNSAADRVAAMREANATRMAIAQMGMAMKQSAQAAKGPALTKGQEAVDRAFGKEYAEYQAGGGSADIEKQLRQLEDVSKKLGEKGNDFTGPAVGLIPDKARAFTNPEAVAAKNKVEEVAQRNLRLVLGAQFTQVEGERLIARAYNPSLPPAENERRVKALTNQIRTAAKVKEDAARYFEENGTLTGWKGRMPTLSDFETAIDNASTTTPSASGGFSIRKK